MRKGTYFIDTFFNFGNNITVGTNLENTRKSPLF